MIPHLKITHFFVSLGLPAIAQKHNKLRQLHTTSHSHPPENNTNIATAADIPARLNRPNRCQTYIDIVGTNSGATTLVVIKPMH